MARIERMITAGFMTANGQKRIDIAKIKTNGFMINLQTADIF